MKNIHAYRGFTLPEFLVLVTVLTILANLSVSGFTTLRNKFRMDNSINHLVRAFHLARHKSRLDASVVTVCKSRDGSQCHNDANWNEGWVVFSNTDADNPPQIDPGEAVLSTAGKTVSLQISANREAFHIRPYGKRSTNGTFRYCSPTTAIRQRAVIVSYTGKPRIEDSGFIKPCTQDS